MTKFNDIMLDLETLGTKSDAAIIQIGACYFNRDTGKIGEKFRVNVEPDLSLFSVEWGTVKWWMLQTEEARQSVTGEAVSMATAIKDLHDFLDSDDVCLWAHATFDIPIIENAFKVMGVKFPIRYKRMRDIRTLTDVSHHEVSWEREGVHHDALDDCIFQVKYCTEAIRNLKHD